MKTLALLLLLSTQALALTGGVSSTNPRYEAIVHLRTEYGYAHDRNNCTGVFISPRHILTAGHCVLGIEKQKKFMPTKLSYQSFPKADLFFDPIVVEPPHVKFIVNPSYLRNPHTTSTDDLAIIEFDRGIVHTPIRLADAAVGEGTEVTATGYGCDVKRKEWETDFQMGPAKIFKPDDFISFHPATVSLCEGDSGSPALVDGPQGLRVVGIASWARILNIFGLARDRYVRVDDPSSAAREWIRSVVQ